MTFDEYRHLKGPTGLLSREDSKRHGVTANAFYVGSRGWVRFSGIIPAPELLSGQPLLDPVLAMALVLDRVDEEVLDIDACRDYLGLPADAAKASIDALVELGHLKPVPGLVDCWLPTWRTT